jgi:hypothetical protein
MLPIFSVELIFLLLGNQNWRKILDHKKTESTILHLLRSSCFLASSCLLFQKPWHLSDTTYEYGLW